MYYKNIHLHNKKQTFTVSSHLLLLSTVNVLRFQTLVASGHKTQTNSAEPDQTASEVNYSPENQWFIWEQKEKQSSKI